MSIAIKLDGINREPGIPSSTLQTLLGERRDTSAVRYRSTLKSNQTLSHQENTSATKTRELDTKSETIKASSLSNVNRQVQLLRKSKSKLLPTPLDAYSNSYLGRDVQASSRNFTSLQSYEYSDFANTPKCYFVDGQYKNPFRTHSELSQKPYRMSSSKRFSELQNQTRLENEKLVRNINK